MLNMLNFIMLQAQGQSPLPTLLLFGGMFVVMYFFMIRPQQKKQKEQQEYVNNLKKGDKVVSIGGMHGTVVSVGEKTIKVEIDFSKGTVATFQKTAISKEFSANLNAEA
jgi:preprotein translocase subunit YajC